MPLTLETDAFFDGAIDDAAVYTNASSVETSVRAIVAPQDLSIADNDMHLSKVKTATIYIRESELAAITVTLEVDTITDVDGSVWGVMTQPTKAGGMLVFDCELQEEQSITLRGRDR